MAIILREEVLVGLDDVRTSLEQALATIEVLVEDLHPRLGEELRATLEHDLLRPLQERIAVLEHLQGAVDVQAT